MRNSIICTELHHLRVDHNQLDLRRLRLIEDTHDQGVDADRLTGTGRSGDQKMRHLGQIGHHDLPADILTHGKSQFRLKVPEYPVIHQLPEMYDHILFVRHLDTDGRFARDRRLDTDIGGRQIQLDIVCQGENLADLGSLLREHLIPGHRRATADVGDGHPHAETLQRALQLHGRLFERPVIILRKLLLLGRQQIHRRENVLLFLRRSADRRRGRCSRPVDGHRGFLLRLRGPGRVPGLRCAFLLSGLSFPAGKNDLVRQSFRRLLPHVIHNTEHLRLVCGLYGIWPVGRRFLHEIALRLSRRLHEIWPVARRCRYRLLCPRCHRLYGICSTVCRCLGGISLRLSLCLHKIWSVACRWRMRSVPADRHNISYFSVRHAGCVFFSGHSSSGRGRRSVRRIIYLCSSGRALRCLIRHPAGLRPSFCRAAGERLPGLLRIRNDCREIQTAVKGFRLPVFRCKRIKLRVQFPQRILFLHFALRSEDWDMDADIRLLSLLLCRRSGRHLQSAHVLPSAVRLSGGFRSCRSALFFHGLLCLFIRGFLRLLLFHLPDFFFTLFFTELVCRRLPFFPGLPPLFACLIRRRLHLTNTLSEKPHKRALGQHDQCQQKNTGDDHDSPRRSEPALQQQPDAAAQNTPGPVV